MGMLKTEIEKEVIKALSETGLVIKDLKINLNETLDDLQLDSLDLIETTMELEDVFDIELPDDFLKGTQTVNNVIEKLDTILNY